MEKLARKLASNISSSLGYDDEKEAVVAYGLIAMIQITLTTLLVLLLGILAGAPVEALIICFSVSILRKYSGGAHAKTAEFCTGFSVIYCILTAVISKRLLAGIYNPIAMAVAIIIIFALSFLIVYKFAPVDSPNKPIRTEKKKKRMRKGSFIILSVYFVMSVTFFLLAYQSEIFESYGIGLLFGISWQIFTLTHLGAQFIGKMNQLFILRKEGQR
jgi:accessory gene regulator B